MYEGIIFQAITLTFGTLFCMLIVYKSGWIRVTEKLRWGVMTAVGAIALIYIVSLVMSFFGTGITYIHESGPIGIGFSLLVIGVASFSLLVDFDLIDRMARARAPKYMEWYGAFALLVTLVWLYIEMLHLLAKLNRD